MIIHGGGGEVSYALARGEEREVEKVVSLLTNADGSVYTGGRVYVEVTRIARLTDTPC